MENEPQTSRLEEAMANLERAQAHLAQAQADLVQKQAALEEHIWHRRLIFPTHSFAGPNACGIHGQKERCDGRGAGLVHCQPVAMCLPLLLGSSALYRIIAGKRANAFTFFQDGLPWEDYPELYERLCQLRAWDKPRPTLQLRNESGRRAKQRLDDGSNCRRRSK
jgi:hypothetical protein